jgi:hypothetical protein
MAMAEAMTGLRREPGNDSAASYVQNHPGRLGYVQVQPILAEACDRCVKHGPGCSASARGERSFGNSAIAPSRVRGPCLGSCSRRCSRLPAPDHPVRRQIELLAREGACTPIWNLLLPEEQDEAKQAEGNALIPA